MRNRASALGLVAGLMLLAACGSSKTASPNNSSTPKGASTTVKESLPPGDIPDNQVYVPFTSVSGGYSLTYPQGWPKRQTTAETTFSQYFNSIAAATTKTAAAPTIASARSAAGTTLASLPGYKLIAVDSLKRPAGTVIRIVYNQTSAVDAVTGKTVTLAVERYLFWHKGTLLTLTLSSAKGSDNVDPWKTVTDSVTWK